MEFVDFQNGITLEGRYNKASKTVMVTMPDGEVLQGKYSAMTNMTMGFGSAYAASGTTSAFATGNSFAVGANTPVYSILRAGKGPLMMEMKVMYNEWSGNGFGEAMTNDGRHFKVQF